ncbi:MAG: ribosomal-processing cysteine protease Prp [Oscillospiraceae bacterium]|nr:ribosomal-processing cysteine protease Prp [Oscillospiraceae bacterium]
MINVSFTQDRESQSIIMKVSGHANSGEKGKDIICSAASILCYTLAQSMEFMYEEGELHKRPHISLKEGDAFVIAKPKTANYNKCLHAFFIIQVGYFLLARSHPDFVELITFGEPETA